MNVHLLVIFGDEDVLEVVQLELVHHFSRLVIHNHQNLLQLGPSSSK